MYSYEQVRQMLADVMDSVPPVVYRGLNGGVILAPEEKLHPADLAGNLYTLGEYTVDPGGMGRYVAVYYGSVMAVHGQLSEAALKDELRRILHHELTHHLEHLAGDRSLEAEDLRGLARYRSEFGAPE